MTLLIITFNLNAQKIFTNKSDIFYQIAPLYDFKQSVVNLTFDDGFDIQFTVGIPMLKKRNLPATFYVITDRVDSVAKSVIFHNLTKDFEIGSHTVTHPNLIKIGNDEAIKELVNSKLYLEQYFGVNAGLTMSYPWGLYDISIEKIVKNNYLAARSTAEGYNSIFTADRFALKMQSFNDKTKASTANSWIDFAIKNQLWLVEMLHGINNIGFSPIDSSVLAEHLDYIKNVDDKIWCSTVCNVIKYIDESKNAKIECEVCNDTVFKIRVNDFMDDSIYNQPLSLKIKVPDNWDSIWISNATQVKTEYYNTNKFILFNALPDNQLITIKPGLVSDVEINHGIRLVYLSSNPFFDNIRLTLEAFDQCDVDIALYDMNGRSVIHQKEKNLQGLIDLFFDTSGIGKGIYILRLNSNDGYLIIKKLIKI